MCISSHAEIFVYADESSLRGVRSRNCASPHSNAHGACCSLTPMNPSSRSRCLPSLEPSVHEPSESRADRAVRSGAVCVCHLHFLQLPHPGPVQVEREHILPREHILENTFYLPAPFPPTTTSRPRSGRMCSLAKNVFFDIECVLVHRMCSLTLARAHAHSQHTQHMHTHTHALTTHKKRASPCSFKPYA